MRLVIFATFLVAAHAVQSASEAGGGAGSQHAGTVRQSRRQLSSRKGGNGGGGGRASFEVTTGAFVNLTAREHRKRQAAGRAPSDATATPLAAAAHPESGLIEAGLQRQQPEVAQPQAGAVSASESYSPAPPASYGTEAAAPAAPAPAAVPADMPAMPIGVQPSHLLHAPAAEDQGGAVEGGESPAWQRDDPAAAAWSPAASPPSQQAASSCSMGESVTACLTPLALVSMCANVVMAAALAVACSVQISEQRRATTRKTEGVARHTLFEPIAHSEADEALLQKLEKLVTASLLVNVRKSPSKSSKSWLKGMKDRFVVPCPMVDLSANGSAASRIGEWRGGFLGWWTTKNEYTDWCASGKPGPKGSLPLESIKEAALQGAGQVVLRYVGEGADLMEMDMVFERPEEARPWVEGFQQFQRLLSARSESSGRPKSALKGPLGKLRATAGLAGKAKAGAGARSGAASSAAPDSSDSS
eukprot:TRINITY_DN26391_c0_g1_i4.p1 TRINITY_DN26391_c0_g1~~TRINITY_DN26391_c0_g1_i4.p1  ORF type:complete len:473 (+),score=120.13 TRINITY_DN26391_c0_g1_i4:121-1539(+)